MWLQALAAGGTVQPPEIQLGGLDLQCLTHEELLGWVLSQNLLDGAPPGLLRSLLKLLNCAQVIL